MCRGLLQCCCYLDIHLTSSRRRAGVNWRTPPSQSHTLFCFDSHHPCSPHHAGTSLNNKILYSTPPPHLLIIVFYYFTLLPLLHIHHPTIPSITYNFLGHCSLISFLSQSVFHHRRILSHFVSFLIALPSPSTFLIVNHFPHLKLLRSTHRLSPGRLIIIYKLSSHLLDTLVTLDSPSHPCFSFPTYHY